MHKRNILIAAVSAVAMAALAGEAFAAGQVQATASATAQIIAPFSLTKTADMNFGIVVRPSDASSTTMTLNANDQVTASGGGTGATAGGTVTTAKFTLAGAPNDGYTTTQAVVMAGGSTGITITAATPVAGNGVYGTIPAGGSQTLLVGGSFTMDNNTLAQTYSGTLTLTVNYN